MFFQYVLSMGMDLVMKLGIDIHGVLNTHTEIIKEIMSGFINNNMHNEVHIITGIPYGVRIQEKFNEWGIIRDMHYTHFFSIDTYLLESGEPFEIINNGRYFSEESWNEAKAIYCRENKIDLMIDDSDIYGKFFTTPYAQVL